MISDAKNIICAIGARDKAVLHEETFADAKKKSYQLKSFSKKEYLQV